MSETLARIRTLILENSVRISEHGYDELADDDLSAREIIEGVDAASTIEDYPTFQGLACSCYSATAKASRYMWFGVFRPSSPRRQCW
jgi:hypothetical protein